MSGDYANNADGRLYLPANLSGFTGPMRGGGGTSRILFDNLLVYVSVNNGNNMGTGIGHSRHAGQRFCLPGNLLHGRIARLDPHLYNLPSGVQVIPTPPTCCSSSKSRPTTTGYGGFASSGWEGVAIDDITVIHRPGTVNEDRRQLANFSTNSTNQAGDERGWMDPSPSMINQWALTTDFGMNPASVMQRSFENSMTTPPG